MPPSAMGVPVAAWPGLVPHCDVLTVLGVLDVAGAPVAVDVVDVAAGVVVPLLLLLQPAAARAMAAASMIVLRVDRAGINLFISLPLGAVYFRCFVNSRSPRS
jgi:hypothetical protein